MTPAERMAALEAEDMRTNTLRINANYISFCLRDLLTQIAERFPGIPFEDLEIEVSHDKTSGCGCHHDFDDYTNFILIRPKCK